MKYALLAAFALLVAVSAKEKLPLHLGQQTIYLLPMGSGFDQYLASELTRQRLFPVTTDPAKATAVLTDHLGESFETAMKGLYPPPEPKPTKDDSSSGMYAKVDGAEKPVGTFARSGKGNFYLVDVKSGSVLWSIYLKPKHTDSKELNHTAARIVSKLREDTSSKTTIE